MGNVRKEFAMLLSGRSLLAAIIMLMAAPSIGSGQSGPPLGDAKYQRFFKHFVNKRSLPAAVMSALGVPENFVGRSFALVTGVSHYPKLASGNQLLEPAQVDIDNLIRYLREEEFFDEIVVLTDQDVTYDNLAFFLQSYFPKRVAQFQHSRFLFAYSGHGFTQGSNSYTLRSDAEGFADRAHSINLTNIKVLIDEVAQQPTTKLLVLLNSCNSGAFLKRPFGNQTYLFQNEGAHAITAGTTKELAWAYPEIGPGSLFFEKLFAGLAGPAAQRGDNGEEPKLILADQVYSYLRREVQVATEGKQTPQFGDISRNGSSGSFFFLNRSPLLRSRLIPLWKSEAVTAGSPKSSLGEVPWPPNAVAGSSYVVSASDTNRVIPLLRLPENFTLRFASDVHDVRWEVGTLSFGHNATIDLSASSDTLQPGAQGADRPGQPSWGVRGLDGGTGLLGQKGQDGINLTLNVGHVSPEGSMWIRTDGGSGGPGGRGGNGQLGGGSSCGNLNEPHTNGGDGGSGGSGGQGGPGGSTSRVRITVSDGARLIGPPTCQTTCGSSQRPQAASIDDGSIVIFGAPGCGGKGGPGGAPGGGGDEGRDRSCSIGPLSLGGVHGGSPGKPGALGGSGQVGTCSLMNP